MQTVGELRKWLAEVPDETPLAVMVDRNAKLIDGEVHVSGKWGVELDGENGVTICGY